MLRHKLSSGVLRAARPLATAPVPSQSANLASAVLLSSQRKWQNETVVKLKDELKRRGLSQTGNKSTLISRLTANESAFPVPSPPASRGLSTTKGRKAAKEPAPNQALTDTAKIVTDADVSAPAAESLQVEQVTKEQEQAVPGLPKLAGAIEREVERKGGELLNVKFPQPAEDKEAEQFIPFVPDNFSSNEKLAKSDNDSESKGPKIMTVASAATHHAGGPSHSLHAAKDAHEEEIADAAADAVRALPSFTQALGSVVTAPARAWQAMGVKPEIKLPETPKEQQTFKKIDRELSDEERRGRWWIAGILIAGLALGGGKRDKKDITPEPKEELKQAGEKAKKAAK